MSITINVSVEDVEYVEGEPSTVDPRCDFCIGYGHDVSECVTEEPFTSVTVTTRRLRDRDDAIDYLRTAYPSGFSEASREIAEDKDAWDRAFEQEIRWLLGTTIYATTEVTVCSSHLASCESCSNEYFQPMATSRHHVMPDLSHRVTGVLTDTIGYFHEYHDALCFDCSRSMAKCTVCECWVDRDSMYGLDWDSRICDDCRDFNEYTWCESCWMYFSDGNECECIQSASGRIEPYSYRPRPVFRASDAEYETFRSAPNPIDITLKKDRVGIPFMGFELEVEAEGNAKRDAIDMLDSCFDGNAYYKHDGSLSDGFEIVTHPMTLAAHAEIIDWSFCGRLTRLGFRSWGTGTCGIHVHISRAAFRTNTHLALFQHLFYKNQNAVTRLAGRNSGQWASFQAADGLIVKHLKGKAYRGRYEAINMTNENTVEIRVFRGSLKEERVRSALELVDAAFWYTKDLHSGAMMNGQIMFPAFSAWVRGFKNRGDDRYDRLIGYLDSGNL